jgi:hypothetical protein
MPRIAPSLDSTRAADGKELTLDALHISRTICMCVSCIEKTQEGDEDVVYADNVHIKHGGVFGLGRAPELLVDFVDGFSGSD